MSDLTEHERIWLEPAPGGDADYGQQWCQDNVWGDGATEYVRADLAAIEVLRAALVEATRAMDAMLLGISIHNDRKRDEEPIAGSVVTALANAHQTARAALGSLEPK